MKRKSDERPKPTVPAPIRSTTYRYMYDMANFIIRAYGDVEYGDVHDLAVPRSCMVGMFRDLCVLTTDKGTWVIRHRENGSIYMEDARGVSDPAKVDASIIITDRRQ